MLSLVKKLLDSNEREVRRLQRTVQLINAFEPELQKLSDDELKQKTATFREALDSGASLDDLLPEAFAVVREASRRVIGLRHFDVQMMGGIVLHEGRIAEMKTGEGKTLVATLPIYLNALLGRGVHLVTVNDYLAKRDRFWMGPIYEFLGLTVGVIQHHMEPHERKEAYLCDITYGTNNEIGFDYLRDNMVHTIEHCVLRELSYAIVDEVDSILIDEARTPLIISGMGQGSTDRYYSFARVAASLAKGQDYHVDEKAHSVPLTEDGVARAERILKVENLYADEHMELAHHLNAALKAKELFRRDVDYVAKDGEIIIVDEFTGRLMFGRRYSDGLHQAIEAKEGMKVRQEDQTLASITFQNFFRLYKKLAGMTGTAATEETEFQKIYNLDVVIMPTHRKMIRADQPDLVYKTEKAKFEAVVEEIKELYERGRPVLVGTRSIEKSEILSAMLKKAGIPHQVLNAKYHEKEAEIIAQAGKLQGVTIATNMAGRGVDIILGGNPPDPEEQKKVIELGGLHILGTERHEARRIDNQLRGRSGRQGDPGSSRFYVSLEDELMRLFGSDRVASLMTRLGIEEDIPIESRLITGQIERAQARVESHHFDIRRQVLDYDDVMNKQREVTYSERRKVLEGEDLKPTILEMLERVLERTASVYVNPDLPGEEWDLEGLWEALREIFPAGEVASKYDLQSLGKERRKAQEVLEAVKRWGEAAYALKEQKLGEEMLRQLERMVLLHMIDSKWIDHLCGMDSLREGIGLRAYGQKDPRIEYIHEAFEMFEGLKRSIEEDTVKYLFRVQVVAQDYTPQYRVTGTNRDGNGDGKPVPVTSSKVGRNDPCPCGSGKKYKKCHGA